jgi:predicted sugar kinase
MSLKGGLIVIENSKLVDRMVIPDNYIYVIGLPNYPKLDAAKSLGKEADAVFKSILDTSLHMKPLFKKLFLKLKKAIKQREIIKIGEIIELIDSNELILAGYERMFPKISKLYFQLRKNIKPYNPLTIFISSAGPGIITICNKSSEKNIIKCYSDLNINQVISAKPANNGVKFLK